MGEPKDVGQTGDVQVKAEPPENAAAVQVKAENAEAVQIEADQDQNIKMSDSDIMTALNNKLGNIIVNAYSLPKPVKRNVKALKKLQLEHVNIEVEFFKELHELEMKYEKMFQPLYEKRHLIVSAVVIPTDEECDFQSDSDDKEMELSNEIEKVKVEDSEPVDEATEDIKGIPEFWLTAFKNAPTIADMIEEYDEPILKHLIDVKAVTVADPMSFYLEFHFEPNEYFTNAILTKSYELRCAPDPTDVFSFEGPEIVKCKGCTIDWKRGKNVTVKTIKKKQKHKARGAVRTVTKTVQNDSFFNFFSPPTPAVPEDEEAELDEETQNILNNDYEVGNLIKDRVIPHAVLFFTGENMVDDEFDEEDEDEEDEDYDEDEDEEDEDDENDKQCTNRKKSQGQRQPQQAPSECQQQ